MWLNLLQLFIWEAESEPTTVAGVRRVYQVYSIPHHKTVFNEYSWAGKPKAILKGYMESAKS